jgi:hypothetical protein
MHIRTSDQEKLHLGIGDYSCNWGTHICCLYETEAERDQLLLGYLNRGDRDGNLQFYCPSEQTHEEFEQKYAHFCPQCASHYRNPDHFSLITPQSFYYPSGTFSPWEMEKTITAYVSGIQARGRRYVRAIAEMAWALQAIPGVDLLMAYESRLNYLIPGSPVISLCAYNIHKFSGALIMQVLRTHPYTLTGGIITQNPYYLHPDVWLAKYAPEYLSPAPQGNVR